MSAKKSPSNDTPAVEALMYEDVKLKGRYSVMEIAMLAAGCRGETNLDRFTDAVELLALVERHAVAGKKARMRNRDRKTGKADYDSAERSLVYLNRFHTSAKIRDAATRDEKTGKIELTSLVGLAYEAATGGKADSSEAMRRYNEWFQVEAGNEMITIQGFRARYVSGTKPVVVHDDSEALELGVLLLGYLEDAPKRKPTKVIQSKKPETKGQIISPKNRGNDIAEGTESGASKAGKPRKKGQFKPKRVGEA